MSDPKPSVTKVACSRCRSKKRKCDGLHPICGPCFQKRFDQPCVYTSPNSVSIREKQPAPKNESTPKDGPDVGDQSSRKISLYRCSSCRVKKVRCDKVIPVCGACAKRGAACSYDGLSKTMAQLEGRPKTNSQARPSLSRKQPTDSLATIISEKSSKRPRVSSPARLDASQQHEESEDDGSSPVATGSFTQFIGDFSPVPTSDPVPVISTTHNSRRRKSDRDSLRRDNHHRSIQFSHEGSRITRNQKRHRTRSSQLPISSESNEVRTHTDDEDADDTTSSEKFLTKLQQITSTRTDSTKSSLKYPIQQENKRISYNGKHASRLKNVEPPALNFDLPPRDKADQLFQSYLKWENVNLPVVDIRNFQLMYEDFWARSTFPGDPHIFYALLNAIFALSCVMIGKPREDIASVFYERARGAMKSEIFHDETVNHVQLYLLSSRYLYAIGSLGPAWSKISLAISLALSLGLHLSSSSQILKSREARELVRKVWHNCMVTQRTIAMAKGLSSVTSSSSSVPLPTPLDSEYIDMELGGEQSPVSDKPSIIEFFNALARLSGKFEEISAFQDEIRSIGVGVSAGKLKTIGLQSFLNLDKFLSDWKESLPSFLQPGNNHPALKNPIVLRHRNILHIQYLYTHLRLRIHFLSIVVTSGNDSTFSPSIDNFEDQVRNRYRTDIPLSISIIRDSALRCVVVAREILDILHQYRDYENEKENEPELIPSLRDNIGYIYSCTTVHLASRTSPLIRAEFSGSYIEESWQLGVKLMESYVGYSDLAKKCLSALAITARATDADAGASNGRGNTSEQASNGQIQALLESLPADLED